MMTKQQIMKELAQRVDHTCLRPEASAQDIERLCREAREHAFHAVFVNGSRVELARHCLEDSAVLVGCAIGFPLGAMDTDAKRYETEAALDAGAQEIDMVLNIGWLKDGADRLVLRELRDIVEAAEERLVKVILETCLLNPEEMKRACALVMDSGAKFVKTSTGLGKAGATAEHVRLLREAVGPDFGVKASGGIRDLAAAQAMLKAGANRLGTSNGVAILGEAASLLDSKS